MKKFVCTFTSTILLSQSIAFAQLPGTIVPIVPAGSGGTTAIVNATGSAVNLTNSYADMSRMVEAAMARAGKVQDVDREYIVSVVTNTQETINEIIFLKRDFLNLANKSLQEPVQLADVLRIGNEIKTKQYQVLNELAAKRVINRDTLPSYSPITINGTDLPIPNYGNVSFVELEKYVTGVVGQLIKEINDIKFGLVVAQNGTKAVPILSNSLNPVIEGLRPMSRQQIDAKRKEMEELSELEADTVDYQNKYTAHLVGLMRQFVIEHGNKQWLMFQNTNDGNAAKNNLISIIEGFFYRSYLRKKYQMPMGAIQTQDYKNIKLNLEDFARQPLKDAISLMRNDAAITQGDVDKAFNNVRQFLELYDKKTVSVFGSKAAIVKERAGQEYVTINPNILIRANAAITYVSGQKHIAVILKDLMALTLADIQEEQMLLRGQNAEMAALHDVRFRGTPQLKDATNKRMCQNDFEISDRAFDLYCPKYGLRRKATMPRGMRGGSVRDIFASLLLMYSSTEAAKIQDSKNIYAMIQASLRAGNSTRDNKINDQIEDDGFSD